MNWWINIFFWWITSYFVYFQLYLTLFWLCYQVLFFYNGQKFFDVINFCCCLILPFVFPRFLNIGISHQSNAPFFTQLSYLLLRLSFRSYASFFEKYLNFCIFLSVLHLVDNYAKILDERGRNLMCDRTLPSLLVFSQLILRRRHKRDLNISQK